MPLEDDPEKNLPDNWEEKATSFILAYKLHLTVLILGLLMISGGLFYVRGLFNRKADVEVLNATTEGVVQSGEVVVEVTGAVNKPGVYKLPAGSRVDDAIVSAGGFSETADGQLVAKIINRAAKLIDGQKIYIPAVGDPVSTLGAVSAGNNGQDQTTSTAYNTQNTKMVNINTASKSELEALWGIGPVTAQNIIDNRIYSSVEELLSKGILKKNVYERNKELLTVY